MRKTKGNVANKTKNNGKFRNIKRYIAASAAVVLAASVVMSSVVKKTEAAENADTLMGIEKLRSSFTSKDKCFTVLEIVPD
ncbi:MAG: hypothetical protein J1F41_08820, partial [Lachnospiraceae bacterium]|nr:hypothetical protein [Lachnospiraceae bacterium]